jgi:hypothetical protein
VYNLLSETYLAELELKGPPEPPATNSHEETLRRARRARERESRYVAAGTRRWWLNERGWLVERSGPDQTPALALPERLLQAVGQLFLRWGTSLAGRAVSAAEVRSPITTGTTARPSPS